MGFYASRAGRLNFGCLHRCTLVRAGRNSVGLLVVILYFYFFIGLQFRAGQSTMPCLHKALFVVRYFMTTSKRPPIPPATQRSIRTKNLGVCCVCKERGIGTNFHHIDGNPTNNKEENIALLCVKEHDQHHRPHAYNQTKHLELRADKILAFKQEWELTVQECKSENPKVLAVVNAFGDLTNIHSVKFLLQNIDGKIIYERLYHWHYGTMEDWTDWIMEEAVWLGKNVKLTIIDKPLDIEHCPCGCKNSLSNIIDKNSAIQMTAGDWKEKSIGTIYINPTFPSFALSIFYGDEMLFQAHLHKCQDRHLHFISDKFEERIAVVKKASVKKQATDIKEKILATWQPGQVFIGTDNPEQPILIEKFKLPGIWEKKNNR